MKRNGMVAADKTAQQACMPGNLQGIHTPAAIMHMIIIEMHMPEDMTTAAATDMAAAAITATEITAAALTPENEKED